LADYFGSKAAGSPPTIFTVSTLTRMTWPTRRTMYSLFVLAVGVGNDAAALVGGNLVLVDDPFEGAAVAEAVVQGAALRDDEEIEKALMTRYSRAFGLAQILLCNFTLKSSACHANVHFLPTTF